MCTERIPAQNDYKKPWEKAASLAEIQAFLGLWTSPIVEINLPQLLLLTHIISTALVTSHVILLEETLEDKGAQTPSFCYSCAADGPPQRDHWAGSQSLGTLFTL